MQLRVLTGARAGDAFEVAHRQLVAGRDPGCDLVLDDEQVSRRHASFEPLDGGSRCLLRDLGSTNGTWVDGRPIAAPVLLEGGEEVRIGNALLALTAAPAPWPRVGRRTVAAVAALACALAGIGTALGLILPPSGVFPGFPAHVATARAGDFAGPGVTGGLVPSRAERVLLRRIPAWQRAAGCWRPTPGLASLEGAVAAVGCLGRERVTVLYWQFASPAALGSWFAQVVDGLDAAANDTCQKRQRASGNWSFNGVVGGRIACGAIDGRDVIAWTATAASIGASISLNFSGAATYKALLATYNISGPVEPGS